MKNRMEKNKTSVFIRETSEQSKASESSPSFSRQKMRKLMVYVLMGAACAGCFYLIFRPKENPTDIADAGLNKSVPQAEDAVLQGDKEKAYEQELLERKEMERKKAMLSLSDYWNGSEDTSGHFADHGEATEINTPESQGARNYREIQQTLGSFYESDPEKDALRRELRELKERQRENESSSQNTLVTDPLVMMEKSYQMAAKYLPQVMPQKPLADTVKKAAVPERYVEPVYTTKKSVVSSLFRDKEQSSEELMAAVLNSSEKRFFDGQNPATSSSSQIIRNSIRACIHHTQTITVGSSVPLRLLEGARIARMTIPAGTLLTATAMVRDGRLALQITSVEYKGNIVPVDLSAYDLDGQMGLNLPYSPDVNAIKEIASGMSTSAGTNIVLSTSTGQQLISDMTKGIVQGTSGYLAKRIGTPRVTIKAGHLLYLVPKK
jgi:conjugative transposon TraM protein